MVWNFTKGSGSDTIGSSDIAALVAGFKITLEGEEVEPVQPAFVQHKAVSVVDENGDEVLAMSSPAATEGGETEVYSKDAVDALLGSFAPESEDINYRLPKAGVEADDVEELMLSSSEIVSGVRVPANGGIGNISSNTQRATVSKIFYIGSGETPANMRRFDISNWKKISFPAGYYGGCTVAKTLSQTYNTSDYNVFINWTTGDVDITSTILAAIDGYDYMVVNFAKGSSQNQTIDSTDIATIAAGFKMRSEIAASDPADAAINIVDEEGEPVKRIYNGGDRDTVEIYSKAAVDGLLSNVTPNPFDSSKARRNLRVAHWNVGHFYLGRNMADGNFIFRTDGENLQKAFTNKVRQIGADVFMMCEWYTCTQSEAIFGDFPYSDTSVDSGDNREYAFKSNFKLNSVEIVNFGLQSPHDDETFKVAEISMGNRTIALIECHLYYGGNYSADKTYRAAEIQAILDYVSTQGYDRVIIAGDFNNGKPNDTLDEGPHELDAFKNAGYQMFNFDLYERVNTYPATGLTDSNYTSGKPSIAIDNILCKGCSIVAANVVDDGRLTDHCCVVCDIVLD